MVSIPYNKISIYSKMNSQKRATAKPKQSKQSKRSKRGGQPKLSLSRLGSLLPTLSASRGRFANSSLLRLQQPHLRQYFEAPPKQRARTTFSAPVKLQEPPKPLVDIIQIPSHSKANESDIPSNITLEMLEDIYSYEFLLDEIDNLKKNAKEIAEEIIKQDEIENLEKDAKEIEEEIKQDNFDKTIIRKIEECKKKVRMLWNKFYTTFKTNAKTLTGGNGDQNAYNAWYNDDEKSSKPIVVRWGFRLSIFSFVYRVLEYCINLLSNKTASASTKSRRYDQQYYIDKMERIRKKTLKDLTKSGIDSTKIEKIMSNFRLVEIEKKTEVLESLKVRDRLERITISELYKEFPPDIRSSSDYNLYQPFKRIKYLTLYGSTLPYQFNRTELLRNMLYVLERHNIKNFIDLHDCEGITNTSDCNPYDLSGERDMFDLAVKVMKTRGRKYINVKGYVDMRSGSYSAWLEISKIPDTSVYETLVHCYMGRGRTGSVLLFLLLRDFKGIDKYIDLIEYRLRKPHLGYDNINELHDIIMKLFDKNRIVDNVFVELFNVEDMKHIRLLRQRLNRIFFFLAKKHKVSHVCLYQHIPSYPLIIEKIKRKLRRENSQWSEEKIELETNYIYGKLPSDDAIISYEFSKTEIYEMSSFDSMYPARIESILDGE